MTTDVTSTSRCFITTSSSVAELRAYLAGDATLPAGRQRDMVSALSSLAKALGRPPEAIPADPAQLRDAIAPLTPAMVGLKPGRWRNVQSLTAAALAHAGIVTVQGRLREKPSAAWLSILSLLGSGIGRHFHLWRFARYCSQAGIAPEAVNDSVIAQYERQLITESLVSEPKRAAREAARAWNAAVAAHPQWPQQKLRVPDNRLVFAPDWTAYPASLIQQIDAWIARLTDRRLFNGRPGKPLKAATVEGLRRQLRAYLGALVEGGVQPEALVDLASVVTPARAAIALNYFWDKAGEKATIYTYKQIQMVLMIARHEAKLPATQIAELEAMVPDLKPAHGRITERNVSRLRQLDDPHKMQALLHLPERLLAKAKRLGPPSIRTAQEVQTAAIIELLLHIPMRLGNLRNLRLGVHVLRDGRGIMRIVVPGNEVKNGTPIDAQLPKPASDLIAAYIDSYRPLLAPDPSDHLFPGKRPGLPKSDQGTRSQIQRALADHVGIEFNPHAFRHLAAYMVLKENPEAHGLVQRLLGHTSLHATMTFYSGLESDAAMQHLDALIARQRQAAKPALPGRRNAVR